MSESAAAYYAELATTHGIIDVPTVLNGLPVPLLESGQELSIALKDTGEAKSITNCYREFIMGLGDFLIRCTFSPEEVPKEPIQEAASAPGTGRHFRYMVESLLKPQRLDTGYLSNVLIRAVTPSDVSASHLAHMVQAIKTRDDKERAVATCALLITTAQINHRGKSTKGFTGFVSMARAVAGPALSCKGRLLSKVELQQNRNKWGTSD
jgi:hypothetical protein